MKSIDNIQLKLDNLWAGLITFYDYNVWSHALTFDIYTNTKSKKKFKVKFLQISTYLFHDKYMDIPTYELSDEEEFLWDKQIELRSISYIPDKYMLNTYLKNEPQQIYINGQVNIFLELWDTEIFLKAKKLQINEEEFSL